MAVTSVVVTDLANGAAKNVVWGTMANADTGEPFEAAQYADRTVQAVGTFGAGGNVAVEGSNDGVTWAALSDQTGVAINLTATGQLKQVAEATRYIRPNISAGDGTTAIIVYMYTRRPF